MVVAVEREEGESGGGRATVESWIGRFGFYSKCQIVIYSISPPFLTSALPGISEKREKKGQEHVLQRRRPAGNQLRHDMPSRTIRTEIL